MITNTNFHIFLPLMAFALGFMVKNKKSIRKPKGQNTPLALTQQLDPWLAE